MNYDVMYIDGDERNADRDHRTQQGSRPAFGSGGRRVPWGSSGTRTVVVPPSRNPTVIHTSQPAAVPSAYAPVPSGYAPGYYQPGMLVAQQPSFASRFGMSTGELIDTAIQVLAAIQALPGAPTAQGDAEVDIENLVTYQGALATHAKRDEQLRTLGNLLVRILK